MTSLPGFTVDIDHNPYLPAGGRDVSAVVTVTAEASDDTPTEPGSAGASAEIIIVDRSLSMGLPRRKLVQARAATVAALDVIRDGTWFAIIGGAGYAQRVYPSKGKMAIADERTRNQAKQTARELGLRGGTAMSTWLRLAYQMFESCPATLRHGILLTDGRTSTRSPRTLQRVLARCEGHYTSDCRGVGTDWEVTELRRVSSALLGTVDIVAEPAGLADDFRGMMETPWASRSPTCALRMWTPANASVKFVKQVAPDRGPHRAPRRGRPAAGDYPTGAWGDESRDYHVCVEVRSASVGNEMLAARISLVLPQGDGSTEVLSQGLVKAVWTDDLASSTRISPQVAHYTGQAELAQSIQVGLEAHRAGDLDLATAKLGAAVRLAHQTGNEGTYRLLQKVVDVVDPKEGTVRFRKDVSEADSMTLDTRSTKTVRVKK